MSSQESSTYGVDVLLTGLGIGESPRWHEDRLWFSNWGTEEIVAVDVDGNGEVVGQGPPGLGWATGWLPDGRLLVTGQELMRREPDGSMVRHADLSGVADHKWNEIVVDGRGISTSTVSASTSWAARHPVPGSSRWSRRTARPARSRTASSSPTAWS